jgi:cytochrome c oxidase subunit 4
MSEHHDSHDAHSEPHIVSIPIYLGIFAILIIGTILTYATALVDLDFIFPGANTLVALLIAFTKTSFVILFFMHVKYSSRLIWLIVVSSFFCLAIMFAFTMQDYLTRSTGTF